MHKKIAPKSGAIFVLGWEVDYLYSTVIDSIFEWLEPAAVKTMRDLHSPLQLSE